MLWQGLMIRSPRTVFWLPALALACRETPVTPGGGTPTGLAQSYGVWAPSPRDDCTAEIHNSYSVVGPDGKLYPTWHPPIDPATGCSFGHDHGRDPRGSALYAQVGPIPFGYANEQLDVYDSANPAVPPYSRRISGVRKQTLRICSWSARKWFGKRSGNTMIVS